MLLVIVDVSLPALSNDITLPKGTAVEAPLAERVVIEHGELGMQMVGAIKSAEEASEEEVFNQELGEKGSSLEELLCPDGSQSTGRCSLDSQCGDDHHCVSALCCAGDCFQLNSLAYYHRERGKFQAFKLWKEKI